MLSLKLLRLAPVRCSASASGSHAAAAYLSQSAFGERPSNFARISSSVLTGTGLPCLFGCEFAAGGRVAAEVGGIDALAPSVVGGAGPSVEAAEGDDLASRPAFFCGGTIVGAAGGVDFADCPFKSRRIRSSSLTVTGLPEAGLFDCGFTAGGAAAVEAGGIDAWAPSVGRDADSFVGALGAVSTGFCTGGGVTVGAAG